MTRRTTSGGPAVRACAGSCSTGTATGPTDLPHLPDLASLVANLHV